jgi:hypothetical protein
MSIGRAAKFPLHPIVLYCAARRQYQHFPMRLGCLFTETITDARGRQRKRYPYKLMMTPYEKLKSLPNAEQYLKPAMSF